MTMKMTKRDLKNMMKECFLELIKEGAFNSVGQQLPPSSNGAAPVSSFAPMHMFQKPQFGTSQHTNDMTMEAMAKQVAANAASGFGDEKTKMQFQSIFEDTILHTLPEQSVLNEQYTEAEVSRDVKKLNEIPGVDLSRLAKIAFSGQKRKLPGQRDSGDDDLG